MRMLASAVLSAALLCAGLAGCGEPQVDNAAVASAEAAGRPWR